MAEDIRNGGRFQNEVTPLNGENLNYVLETARNAHERLDAFETKTYRLVRVVSNDPMPNRIDVILSDGTVFVDGVIEIEGPIINDEYLEEGQILIIGTKNGTIIGRARFEINIDGVAKIHQGRRYLLKPRVVGTVPSNYANGDIITGVFRGLIFIATVMGNPTLGPFFRTVVGNPIVSLLSIESPQNGISTTTNGNGTGLRLTWDIESVRKSVDLSHLEEQIIHLHENKQDTLISGHNIRTINGQSILGSGNIIVEGNGSSTPDCIQETGLWSPILEAHHWEGNQQRVIDNGGHYIRQGNLVTVSFRIPITPRIQNSTIFITGLPFLGHSDENVRLSYIGAGRAGWLQSVMLGFVGGSARNSLGIYSAGFRKNLISQDMDFLQGSITYLTHDE